MTLQSGTFVVTFLPAGMAHGGALQSYHQLCVRLGMKDLRQLCRSRKAFEPLQIDREFHSDI